VQSYPDMQCLIWTVHLWMLIAQAVFVLEHRQTAADETDRITHAIDEITTQVTRYYVVYVRSQDAYSSVQKQELKTTIENCPRLRIEVKPTALIRDL